MLNTLANITTIAASATVIIGSIWVASNFRYKHDAEVRKMLIENYKKFEPIAKGITGAKEAKAEQIDTLWKILNEAELCFHPELVEFIESFKNEYIDLHIAIEEINSSQSNREKTALLKKLPDDLKKLKKLYRKQLVHEPLWYRIREFFSKTKKFLRIILFLIIFTTMFIA